MENKNKLKKTLDVICRGLIFASVPVVVGSGIFYNFTAAAENPSPKAKKVLYYSLGTLVGSLGGGIALERINYNRNREERR